MRIPFLSAAVIAALSIAPLFSHSLPAQFVSVGEGSYTTVFPGTDVAGRNGVPPGTPQLSGNALGRPIPTNDWWSLLLRENHVANLFNYPMAMRTLPTGLDVGYIVAPSGPGGSAQPLSDISPIVVGVTGLNAPRATIADYSDWTVTMAWASGAHTFEATSGKAMPFLYFRKSSGSEARIVVNVGTATVSGPRLLITNSQGGSHFAVYAPAGSVWTQTGNTFTSTLNGQDYWSMAKLPPSAASPAAVADAYREYAFAFPVNTEVEWQYDEATSVVRTDFRITAEAQEGTGTTVLQGLLPHQWGYLASDSPVPQGHDYPSIRGTLKMLEGNHFATERTFHGILPTLPFIPDGSDRFRLDELQAKVNALQNESLSTWTDSYNEGQVMNRLIQTARIADLVGNTEGRDLMIATVRERLEDWLRAEPGEVAFLFFYNTTWTAMIGYPAGHGQDTNLNDHHFHWGYFIHAAAFVEQFNPGWAADWGGMIDLLIRDAASPDREDPMFPFLRNFSPYAGHAWANGFATFPLGNDQESTSESMQFNSSLIHWGTLTGNTAVRDLGIYLYVTEQTATEEYWFDVNNRTFKPEYNFALASRIWGNGYDNQTFWTGDIAAAYGIELYPIHGGSLYLGHNHAYAERLWAEMAQNTGILVNQPNVNLWHDVYWKFLAFTDASAALDLHDSYPDRSLKFGISDAQTYHWLHAMKALGRVDATITADYPVAAAFNKDGETTYVAHNYGEEDRTVLFSDGGSLFVPARTMASSQDSSARGVLSTSFTRAYPGGSVDLEVEIVAGEANEVEFFRGSRSLGVSTQAPHRMTAGNLPSGVHTVFARVYAEDRFSLTNSVSIQVGDQVPYEGAPWAIPGTVEAGKYDIFEGGVGQGVAYRDNSLENSGDFRRSEYVDAALHPTEGAYVGWIAAGEWLEYTVFVEQAGIYNLTLRYASGNSQGGGPLSLTLNGEPVRTPFTVPTTNSWDTFGGHTVSGLELPAGEHVLRVTFVGGELNLGRMSFAFDAPFATPRPVADAGGNRAVLFPVTNVTLSAVGSSVAAGLTPDHHWEQVFGPSVIAFSDSAAVDPVLTNLVEGVYRIRLHVSDGTHTARDEINLIVTQTEELPPTVSITQPATGFSMNTGRTFSISATAQDLDGTIESVAFYSGEIRIGQVFAPPYAISWKAPVGDYILTAVATDNDGLSAVSEPVIITILPPEPCEALASNGDFSYRLSASGEPPSITFIPAIPGMGSNVCILYLSTGGGGPFAGTFVTPNVPFLLPNVSEGDTVIFYYTYSHPAGGERNTSQNPVTRVIGACGEDYIPTTSERMDAWRRAYFPAETLADPALEASVWGNAADPLGTGVPNLIRFFRNEDPLLPAENTELYLESGEFVYRYTRLADLPPEFGGLEYSGDLRSWTGIDGDILESGGGVERIEVRIGIDGNDDPMFLRLRAGP